MKRLILIPLVAIFFNSAAQELTIWLKNGEVKSVETIANSSGQLMTNQGTFYYSDIDSVNFKDYDSRYALFSSRLQEHGVKTNAPVIKSPIIVDPKPLSREVRVVDVNYQKFVAQRNGGKLLQLAGLAGLAISSYMSITYQEENMARQKSGEDMKEFPKFLPWAALGAMGIGIVIDMDAGKHLKKRTR